MLYILFLAFTLLVQLTVSSPYVDNQASAQHTHYEFDTSNMPNSYKFHYDAPDGSSRNEQGAIQNPGTNDAALHVAGAVRWYNDKGHLYEMTYKAGKRGYRTIIKRVYL